MNIAVLSGWHVHAVGYAKEAAAMPGVQITAAWDELPERGEAWAKELGCPFVADYETILADPTIDGVMICAPTNRHAEIMIRAAEAGKHIFTEKVLTLSDADADAVAAAVHKNNIHFTISFPHRTRPELLAAKKLAYDGTLGTLTYARVRNVHSGSIKDWLPPHFYSEEQCGGGAMIDLGAHPMYTLLWLLGKPKQAASIFTNVTDRPVEDNAVSVIAFENGAIGVSETGFVSACDPYVLEISGTKGYVRVCDGIQYRLDGQQDWITPNLPEKLCSPLAYWIESVQKDYPNMLYTIDEAVALTRLMSAAYASARGNVIADVQP